MKKAVRVIAILGLAAALGAALFAYEARNRFRRFRDDFLSLPPGSYEIDIDKREAYGTGGGDQKSTVEVRDRETQQQVIALFSALKYGGVKLSSTLPALGDDVYCVTLFSSEPFMAYRCYLSGSGDKNELEEITEGDLRFRLENTQALYDGLSVLWEKEGGA